MFISWVSAMVMVMGAAAEDCVASRELLTAESGGFPFMYLCGKYGIGGRVTYQESKEISQTKRLRAICNK